MARGDDRYTRDDVKRLAMARGIKISGKTMTDLCNEVGISRAQVLPRGSSSSPVRAGKKPSISPARSPRVRPPVLSRSVSSDSSSSSRSFSSGPSFSSSPSFSSGPSSYSPVPKQPSPALIRKQAQFFNEPSLWGNPPQDVSGGLFSQRRSIPSEAVQVFPRPRMGSMSGEEASVSSTSDVSDRIPASASSGGDVFDRIPVPSRKKRTGLTSEQRQSLVDELVSIKPQAARRSARLQNKM
jgi:hypothetical protein